MIVSFSLVSVEKCFITAKSVKSAKFRKDSFLTLLCDFFVLFASFAVDVHFTTRIS